MRKTVSIEWLKEKGNSFLEKSDAELAEQRVGVSALLEAALFETGNYKGFQVLTSFNDDTRRRYF